MRNTQDITNIIELDYKEILLRTVAVIDSARSLMAKKSALWRQTVIGESGKSCSSRNWIVSMVIL